MRLTKDMRYMDKKYKLGKTKNICNKREKIVELKEDIEVVLRSNRIHSSSGKFEEYQDCEGPSRCGCDA